MGTGEGLHIDQQCMEDERGILWLSKTQMDREEVGNGKAKQCDWQRGSP